MRLNAKMASSLTFAVLAISAIAPALRGDEALRWKFKPGEKLDYKMAQDMTMTGEGGPLGQMQSTMRQEMDMTWDVQEVNEQGDAIIRQKFARLKTKMTMPAGEFEYDSQSEEAPAGVGAMLAPMYEAMTQGEFIISMTSRGEVKDVKIPEEVVTALKNSPMAAGMGDLATSDGFKKMISQGALVLPEKMPQPGETWSTKVEMNNPAAGTQTIETTYRYEGTKDIDGVTYAVIRPQLKIEFGKNPQPNVQVKIGDQSSSGELLFNVAEGRLHSSTLKQVVAMEIAAGGQTMKQKIDQQMDVTVTPAAETESEAKSTESEAKSTESEE
jgi:hypothetical protein